MQSSLSDDPDWRSAIDLAAALRHRETSAAETLEAVLERADRVGPVLNPFSVQLYQRAGEAARLRLRVSGDKLCGQADENCAGTSDEGFAHPTGHPNE